MDDHYTSYKDRFIEIIIDSFEGNPSVLDVVKQDRRVATRIRRLAEYAFQFGERREANYLSSDRDGIVIGYVEDMKRSLKDHWWNTKLILQVAGVERAGYLLKKEAYRKKIRPQEPFFYIWFIGVETSKRGGNCIKELKKWVFDQAEQLQLPILLETTIEKNKKAYEYHGFSVYHVHRFHPNTPPTYFMKKELT